MQSCCVFEGVRWLGWGHLEQVTAELTHQILSMADRRGVCISMLRRGRCDSWTQVDARRPCSAATLYQILSTSQSLLPDRRCSEATPLLHSASLSHPQDVGILHHQSPSHSSSHCGFAAPLRCSVSDVGSEAVNGVCLVHVVCHHLHRTYRCVDHFGQRTQQGDQRYVGDLLLVHTGVCH